MFLKQYFNMDFRKQLQGYICFFFSLLNLSKQSLLKSINLVIFLKIMPMALITRVCLSLNFDGIVIMKMDQHKFSRKYLHIMILSRLTRNKLISNNKLLCRKECWYLIILLQYNLKCLLKVFVIRIIINVVGICVWE